ncbi:MAG TPA: hypothetical protein VJU77_04445 [Chthoniobacterales bacterium]|nr:hypothetical protein [Chthoniobacterales bacterium]
MAQLQERPFDGEEEDRGDGINAELNSDDGQGEIIAMPWVVQNSPTKWIANGKGETAREKAKRSAEAESFAPG